MKKKFAKTDFEFVIIDGYLDVRHRGRITPPLYWDYELSHTIAKCGVKPRNFDCVIRLPETQKWNTLPSHVNYLDISSMNDSLVKRRIEYLHQTTFDTLVINRSIFQDNRFINNLQVKLLKIVTESYWNNKQSPDLFINTSNLLQHPYLIKIILATFATIIKEGVPK